MKSRSWVLSISIFVGVLLASISFFKRSDTRIEPAVLTPKNRDQNEGSQQPLAEKSHSPTDNVNFSRAERQPKSTVSQSAPDLSHAKLEKSSWLEDSRWKVWKGVSAFPKGQQPVEGRLIGEISGYTLVETQQDIDAHKFQQAAPIVVVDSRLGTVGVVTGILSVVLKEGIGIESLIENSNLVLRDSQPQIRTYFVTASEEPFDLVALIEFLKSHSAVDRAQLEILSRQYEKF